MRSHSQLRPAGKPLSCFFHFAKYPLVTGGVKIIGEGRSARPLCSWETDWPFDGIVLRASTPQVSEILTENATQLPETSGGGKEF